jgi:dipeptidyl aminopeptidase/acylaminoacyl peptidase
MSSVVGLIAAAMIAATPQAQPGQVSVVAGDLYWQAPGAPARRLTHRGLDRDPALSPDGRRVVFVRTVKPAAHGDDAEVTALFVFDLASGRETRVIAPRASADAPSAFTRIRRPTFSLNGRFVYVLADAWATTEAVHQVDLTRGSERFVVDGDTDLVIRDGPWRGYLLVQRRIYRPEGGADTPTWVVRPDGKPMFEVPGTAVTGRDSGRGAVARWLRAKGWRAS